MLGALSDAWQEHLPWYPGDWVWPVLLGLVIAAIGATAAIALAHDGDGGKTIVATGGGPPHTPTTPAATGTVPLPTVPQGTPTATTAPPQAPTTTTPRTPGTLVSWPAARSGYTVVLESIPTRAGRSFAVARARAASRAGLPQVGVLDSGRFSSLHAGYFVVFSGVYPSRPAADEARSAANGKGFGAAYARQITR